MNGMTDTTELAQREKFEAWWEREYKHLESSKYTDAVPHIKYGFWMAYQAGGAELVEALEKAQADGSEYAASERAEAVKNVALQDEIYGLKSRIAELESRSVKLPSELELRNNEVCSVCAGNALQVIEDKLTAADIKWEAE
ncbi:TPA: hypothetical protein LVK93_000855 [Klebsiella michiganensis]|nr:hypothetical protein [Klebsiella michiganensis]